MSILHDYNYVRVPFIAKSYNLLRKTPITEQSKPETETNQNLPSFPIFAHADERAQIHLEAALKGVRILDIGCGGGILSEPLAKSGAHVVGIDPSEELIRVAKSHLEEDFRTFSKRYGLRDDYSGNLKYLATSVEEYATQAGTETFDIVVASEVLEHIDNDSKASFVATLCKLVRPGGLLVFTTPGRSLVSYLTNIWIAESVLRLVPAGSHIYDLFIAPNALARILRDCSFSEVQRQGLFYLPFDRRFIHIPNSNFLYMISFKNNRTTALIRWLL